MRRITCFFVLCLPFLLSVSCGRHDDDCDDYRQAMRDFVVRISETARLQDADFVVIPQNGIELVVIGEDASSEVAASYLSAIDGHGQEDLFYGYSRDDKPTAAGVTDYLLSFLHISQQAGNSILVTDYCSRPEYVADAHARCDAEGFVSFVATSRELDIIPQIAVPHENENDITTLADAKNFLYLLNTENFETKTSFIESVSDTNYDVIIMDLFFNDGISFTADEITQLKRKANGGNRMVICYMSIGEAEDYRYYWKSSWSTKAPAWLERENPHWKGNYKVRYWHQEWQELICGSGDSYLNRVLAAGFDGVYLDIIDAFEYFE